MLLPTPFPFILHRLHHLPCLLLLARHSRLLSSPYIASLSTSYHLLARFPTSRPQLRFPVKAIHTRTSTNQEDRDFPGLSPSSLAAHPWPEWSRLIDFLSSGGYFYGKRRAILIDDEFVAYEEFSDEFLRASSACLAFARDQSDVLGLLSRRDIGVVVENGTAFLFKSALDTAGRMRAFLGNVAADELDFNKAHTVDLMKYLLSYVSNTTVSLERSNLHTGELIESAVRNLLSEFVRLGCGVPAPESSASVEHQFPDRYGHTPRPLGQNTEMKRGDWICPRCTFMNFARNVKCLRCEDARPKRQLIGGEWECPRCDFVNYGKNLVCLRCDCKRPGDASFGITNSSSVFGNGDGLYANKADIESRLSANEEKTQGWFTKVSQLHRASDLSNAAADEDFTEIMPLRKGVKGFESTRKTPMERRLATSQFQRDAANTVFSEILCRTSTVSEGDKNNVANAQNSVLFVPSPNGRFAKNPEKTEETERVVAEEERTASTNLSSGENLNERKSHITYGLPISGNPAQNSFDSLSNKQDGRSIDFFGKESRIESTDLSGSSTNQSEKQSVRSGWTGKSLEGSGVQEPDPLDMSEEAKAQRWFRRVAQIKDISELSQIPDEDFPSIMPMRKGVNRFVVSKRKTPLERRLTSPQYRKNLPVVNSDPLKKKNENN